MGLTRLVQPAPRSHARTLIATWLLGVLTLGTPASTQAAALGLTFNGTADLSAFGASSASTFDGMFTWDPDQVCGSGGGGEGDFPLSRVVEGEPPCVAAALRVNGVSHDDFDPEWSRLMLFPNFMVLQLWWSWPLADLDGGPGPDAKLVELELWGAYDPDRLVFPDITELPRDRSFLRRLPIRTLTFQSEGCFEFEGDCMRASAESLTVVPEPATPVLLLAGMASARLWRRWRVNRHAAR